jgi:UDP-N-acetylmuramoyl-L-alanyl-D-glutamate--2,6-diaminopimelate ligase
MKVLKEILYKVSLISTVGDMDVPVKMVRFDSRAVEPGDLFVAVRGTTVDGHAYIGSAVERGAVAVVCEEDIREEYDITFAKVRNSAEALAVIAGNYYGNPSRKLRLVGITGTNGKTTVAFLLYQLFRKLGYNTGLLSTVTNMINDDAVQATHTTADAVQINRLLKAMVEKGCTHCFMEASSHAIDQDRVFGLDFDVAVFTNITHDHLDYHRTFDAYIKAKKKLFDNLPKTAHALVNADDRRSKVIVQNTRAAVRTFALKTMSDYRGRILSDTLQGLEIQTDRHSTWFRLLGAFNAYNLLAAYGVAILLGEEEEEVLTQLSSVDPVPGRFQRVYEAGEIIVIIDYAHTPDALENVLQAIGKLRAGEKVITVVGCGGNRDQEKRPRMGGIAARLSDRVILTSDNPRNEEPMAIIDDMKGGIGPSQVRKVLTVIDRAEALKTALLMAESNDIVLVAGKGHEDYQEIAGKRHHFSDREKLVELLRLLKKDK